MNRIKWILGLGLTLVLVSCSNQWRDSDSLLTPTDVNNMLAEIETSAQSQGAAGDMAQALALKDVPGVSIYVAYAPTPTVKVGNVLGLFSYDMFGGGDLGLSNITDVRVIFMEAPMQSGRDAALIVGIKTGGADQAFSYTTFYGAGTGNLGDTKYEATVTGPTGQILIESFDVDGDELGSVIQLKLYDVSQENAYLGKISTMTGFSY